ELRQGRGGCWIAWHPSFTVPRIGVFVNTSHDQGRLKTANHKLHIALPSMCPRAAISSAVLVDGSLRQTNLKLTDNGRSVRSLRASTRSPTSSPCHKATRASEGVS